MPQSDSAPRIGVLAIQGDYEAHALALTESGATASLVKTPGAFADLDGLVMPGGESTTMLKFLARDRFFEALQEFARQKPVFGTCAGAILLARQVLNPTHPHQPQQSLGILNITIERNAYGAQRDSAILMLEPDPVALPGGAMETVFIRAPRILKTGSDVETLLMRDGFPVLVREGKTMAATFHPEISTDRRVHRLFVDSVIESKR